MLRCSTSRLCKLEAWWSNEFVNQPQVRTIMNVVAKRNNFTITPEAEVLPKGVGAVKKIQSSFSVIHGHTLQNTPNIKGVMAQLGFEAVKTSSGDLLLTPKDPESKFTLSTPYLNYFRLDKDKPINERRLAAACRKFGKYLNARLVVCYGYVFALANEKFPKFTVGFKGREVPLIEALQWDNTADFSEFLIIDKNAPENKNTTMFRENKKLYGWVADSLPHIDGLTLIRFPKSTVLKGTEKMVRHASSLLQDPIFELTLDAQTDKIPDESVLSESCVIIRKGCRISLRGDRETCKLIFDTWIKNGVLCKLVPEKDWMQDLEQSQFDFFNSANKEQTCKPEPVVKFTVTDVQYPVKQIKKEFLAAAFGFKIENADEENTLHVSSCLKVNPDTPIHANGKKITLQDVFRQNIALRDASLKISEREIKFVTTIRDGPVCGWVFDLLKPIFPVSIEIIGLNTVLGTSLDLSLIKKFQKILRARMEVKLTYPSTKVPLKSMVDLKNDCAYIRKGCVIAVFARRSRLDEIKENWEKEGVHFTVVGKEEYLVNEKFPEYFEFQGEIDNDLGQLTTEITNAGNEAIDTANSKKRQAEADLEEKAIQTIAFRCKNLESTASNLVKFAAKMQQDMIPEDENMTTRALILAKDMLSEATTIGSTPTLDTPLRYQVLKKGYSEGPKSEIWKIHSDLASVQKLILKLQDLPAVMLQWEFLVKSNLEGLDGSINVVDTSHLLAFGLTENPSKKVIIPFTALLELDILSDRPGTMEAATARMCEIRDWLYSPKSFGHTAVVGPCQEMAFIEKHLKTAQSVLPGLTCMLPDDRILLVGYGINNAAKKHHVARGKAVQLYTEDTELAEKAEAVGMRSSKPPLLH